MVYIFAVYPRPKIVYLIRYYGTCTLLEQQLETEQKSLQCLMVFELSYVI